MTAQSVCHSTSFFASGAGTARYLETPPTDVNDRPPVGRAATAKPGPASTFRRSVLHPNNCLDSKQSAGHLLFVCDAARRSFSCRSGYDDASQGWLGTSRQRQ